MGGGGGGGSGAAVSVGLQPQAGTRPSPRTRSEPLEPLPSQHAHLVKVDALVVLATGQTATARMLAVLACRERTRGE